jgi:transposase
MAAIGNGAAFAKGRDFAAWLGLVPKQMSTGDRTILGRISSRMRRTDRKLTPTAFANRRPVQCSLLAAAGQVPGRPLHGDCRQRRLSCRGSGRQCLPP